MSLTLIFVANNCRKFEICKRDQVFFIVFGINMDVARLVIEVLIMSVLIVAGVAPLISYFAVNCMIIFSTQF